MATVRFGSVSRFGSTLGRLSFKEPRNRTQSMFGSIIPERILGFPGHSFLMAFLFESKSFKKNIARHTDWSLHQTVVWVNSFQFAYR